MLTSKLYINMYLFTINKSELELESHLKSLFFVNPDPKRITFTWS